MRKHLVILATVVLTAGIVLAKDFWEKPFNKWSQKQVLTMLNDSPWCKQMVLTSQQIDAAAGDAGASQMGSPKGLISGGRGYGMDKGSGIGGEKELFDGYTVRLFSALPVREAYVRMMQLQNNYDQMSATDKAYFDQKFSRALRMDFSKDIIVSITLSSNNRELNMEVDRQLKQATVKTLEQSAYLISDHAGRIPLKGYYPPSPDGTGAKLVFPREIDGKPAVNPDDKEVKLEFYVPGPEHKVYIVWKVKDMMVKGKLNL